MEEARIPDLKQPGNGLRGDEQSMEGGRLDRAKAMFIAPKLVKHGDLASTTGAGGTVGFLS